MPAGDWLQGRILASLLHAAQRASMHGEGGRSGNSVPIYLSSLRARGMSLSVVDTPPMYASCDLVWPMSAALPKPRRPHVSHAILR